MKRLFTLLCIILCFLTKARAQTPLIADAGPDKYWCNDMAKSGTDTPRLGGLVPASGGVPPYTYQWTFRTPDYTYSNRYLDSFKIAKPLVTEVPQSTTRENTAIALLVVHDANGAEARDSVAVFFQKIVSVLGTVSKMKRLEDTVRIGGDQAQDQFPPYHHYLWLPTTGLIDPTERTPLCYAHSFSTYDANYIDSVGCYVCCGQAIVEIIPTSIEFTSGAMTTDIQIFVGSDRHLLVNISGTKRGRISLYSIDGKELLEQVLSEGKSTIALPSIPGGLFIYKIKMNDGRIYSGKLQAGDE